MNSDYEEAGSKIRFQTNVPNFAAASGNQQIGARRSTWMENRDTALMQCKSILIFITLGGNVSHVRRRRSKQNMTKRRFWVLHWSVWDRNAKPAFRAFGEIVGSLQ